MTRASALRVLALAGGLVLTWLIVRSLGWERVAIAVGAAGPWLPLVVALEAGIAGTDWVAVRALIGPAPHPRTWLRSSAVAYATQIVLPAGRVAGEAARATVLKSDVDVGRAAGAAARMSTATFIGTSAICVVAALAALGKSTVLAAALGVNALVCGGLAVAVLAAVQWKWLIRRLPFAPTSEKLPATAVLASLAGRALQTLQYGVVLHAVGGAATARGALVVQGIHIVGASVGDAVPNQVGITDGAYRVFAGAADLGAEPARAVSIALVVRVAQLSLAAAAWLVAVAMRPTLANRTAA